MKEIKIGDRSGSLTVVDLCVRVQNKNNPNRTTKFIKCKCDCGGEILARPTDWSAGKYKKCKQCEPNPLVPGQRFGKLTIVKRAPQKEGVQPRIFYECKCDCGNTTIVSKGNLTSGNIKSCGCGKYKHGKVEVGKKYGKLTIIKALGYNKEKERTEYLANCDCGTKNYVVSRENLVRSEVPSCGCNNRFGSARLKELHPELIPHLHRAKSILDRTRNPKDSVFHNYGGRGIKCELGDTPIIVAYNISKVPNWFKGAELDRIDNDGNYTIWHPEHGYGIWLYEDPITGKNYKALGNLRWVTSLDNMVNSSLYKPLKNKEAMSDRLMTMESFAAKCNMSGFKMTEFLKREIPLSNLVKTRSSYKPVYLFCHNSMTEKQRNDIYEKFKNYYEEGYNNINKRYEYNVSEAVIKNQMSTD